jgi:hypothetical protein
MLSVNSKVKVREDLQADVKYDDIYCHAGMLKFKGKTVTIGCTPFASGYGKHSRNDVFNINEDLEGYLWSARMLERQC